MIHTDEALRLALEALKKSDGFLYNWHENSSDDEADAYATARQLNEKAITAIKAALEAKDEPVAYPEGDVVGPCICGSWPGGKCLKCPRITPPQRTWVGLTDEEVTWLCNTAKSHEQTWGMFVRAIEAKLKEKNHA